MRRAYLIGLNVFLIIAFLSNIHLINHLNKIGDSYTISAIRAAFYSYTKSNWTYGFFASDSFGFMTYEMRLYNRDLNSDTLIISNNQNSDLFISDINYIRRASLFQTALSDSLYAEACTKSVALYYFQKYQDFNNMDLAVFNNNIVVNRDGNLQFKFKIEMDTVYSKTYYF